MDENIEHGGNLTEKNLAKYHIKMKEGAAELLVERLGGKDAVNKLGKEYIGEGDSFTTIAAITLRLSGINAQNERYEGLLADLYSELTGKDINAASKDPLSVMNGFMQELFKQQGYIISEDERNRRASIILARSVFWDNEKIAQLKMICNETGSAKSWAEIGNYFNVGLNAIKQAAGRYGIKKPYITIMDVGDRHEKLIELCNSGENLTLDEIGKELGILNEESSDRTALLSLYCKNMDIKIPDMRSVRTTARRYASSFWFQDNGSALKDLKYYLETKYPTPRIRGGKSKHKYGLSHEQMGKIMGMNHSSISEAKRHLMIMDTNTGEKRMKTDEELDKFIEEILIFVEENLS